MREEEQQRLSQALAFALLAHGDQRRKGGPVPYASHLLQVAGLVLEYGGDVEQAMAALLHDTLEDCEGVDEALIARRFGAGVAQIVRDCTDTRPGENPKAKRPWKTRKTEYLRRLRRSEPRSLLVALCDKLQNATATVMDLRTQGRKALARFNAPAAEQLWYFRSVRELARERAPKRLQLALEGVIGELEERLDTPARPAARAAGARTRATRARTHRR